MTSALTHRNPESSALELPGRVPILSRLNECSSRLLRVDRTRSSPPLYERYTVASTARSYTPLLPRTGVWVFWRKTKLRVSPRDSTDAVDRDAICLAPLVRTSNASPPAFPEGLLRDPLLVLESFRWPISRGDATTVLVRAAYRRRDCRHHFALRKRGEISPYEL